jgi:hypothetical protein
LKLQKLGLGSVMMMEGEMVMVGKRKADEGTSSGGPAGTSQTLLSPKLRRLAQTVIPFHAVVELRRMEDEEAEKVTKMGILPPNELIGLGSPVLDIVMGYLDQKSLKNSRGVCKSWEDAARRALMKQCGLNVEAFFNGVRPSEQNRVEFYSSWILKYRSLAGSKRKLRTRAWPNFLQEWGKGAKSLTFTGLTLDADCRKWIRRLLCVWCPNVVELTLQWFEDGRKISTVPLQDIQDFRTYLDDRDTVKFEQILMAKEEDHAFAPYAVLPNIQSLRVGKMSNKTTSFFSINVLLSCPNVKRLFVSEQRSFEKEKDPLDVFPNDVAAGDCIILNFLSKRPNITTKLETFEWQDDNEIDCWPAQTNGVYRKLERKMEKCRPNAVPTPFLQFGNNLKSLHWNVLHLRSRGRLLFPGVLEQVAGNLRKLDLRVCRTSSSESSGRNGTGGCQLGRRFGLINRPPPLPTMPKLSTIQIRLKDCFEVSLNELVDAAPNLTTLEISGCERCNDGWAYLAHVHEGLWKARPSEQTLPHPNLKCLKSGLTLWNTQVLQRDVNKFPNLEELWMSTESDGNYRHDRERDNIFHTLEQLNSLKRFKLTIHDPIQLYEMLAGVAEAGARMSSLESCHIQVCWLRCIVCSFHPNGCGDRMRLLSNRTELLERILKTKQSACKFIVTVRYEDILDKMEGNSSFSQLPIARGKTICSLSSRDIVFPSNSATLPQNSNAFSRTI